MTQRFSSIVGREPSRLFEVFLVFLRLGLSSFGGPVAHLAYFREEFVARRKWLDEHTYADLVGLCQFLPGPASSQVGVAGSVTLFLAGAALHLFATTSLGILLATLARSMPQFGLLVILVLLPLNMLSGANTPRESIPFALRELMLLAPTTHFVESSQAILFRGAGLVVAWRPFLALAGIGAVLFGVSLARFGQAMRRG